MKKLSLLFAFFAVVLYSFGQIPERPSPPRLVNDFAQILDANQAEALERKLVAYNDSTSTQIAVVTVESLGGYAIEEFSYQLAHQWGIGQKDKNNGVLVLVALNDRRMRIEVGYGLEPVITDAASKRIIEDYMKPAFKQQDFYGGLDEATTVLMKLASGEFKADAVGKKDGISIGGMIILFIIILFALRFFGGWPLLMLFGGSRHGGGMFDDFSQGRGGFGGFGGGDFGGGGSSGRW